MDLVLRRILSRYPAEIQSTAPFQSLGNAGGQSGARLWRYVAGTRNLLLRAWPVPGPTSGHLQQIHEWLTTAETMGILPVPIPTRDGRTFVEDQGRFWQIEPWMSGEAYGRDPAPGVIRAAFAGLAALHQALDRFHEEGRSPGLGQRVQELNWLLQGGLDRIERVLDRASPGPCRDLAREWVKAAHALGPTVLDELKAVAGRTVTLQPCLRDARPDHFLFEGSHLRAVIDFGAMGLETISADVSRLLSEWFLLDPTTRQPALEGYETVGPIGLAESLLIDSFVRSTALLGPARWVRWGFLEQRVFEDPLAVRHGLERGLRRLTWLRNIRG